MNSAPERQPGQFTTMKRLTKPQLELLQSIGTHSHYVADYYPPRKILLKLGLVEAVNGGDVMRITPAGTSFLEYLRMAEKGKAK